MANGVEWVGYWEYGFISNPGFGFKRYFLWKTSVIVSSGYVFEYKYKYFEKWAGDMGYSVSWCKVLR